MTYDLGGVLPKGDVRCVAVCDVQAERRKAGKKLVDQHYGNKDCVLYRDFRDLLARADINAVLIGTGDRWHAPASILAAQAGKDVYSEKPCGLTITAAVLPPPLAWSALKLFSDRGKTVDTRKSSQKPIGFPALL